MWILFALASAVFAGAMSVLAKIGIKDTDSNLATALRTVVVALFAWLMVLIAGSGKALPGIGIKSLVFLVLSGLATGGSWLCYFKALQIGDVNKVAPVDKSSTVLTMLLSVLLFNEGIGLLKAASMLLIGGGTYLMTEQKPGAKPAKGYLWLVYAALSAVFASMTAILGKAGIVGVESNLGTAIRTLVVLALAWAIVFWRKSYKGIRQIDRRGWAFIGLSGIATGLSWLCYYRALQDGPASIVVPIDKLSIVVTVAFGYFILHEKLKRRALAGLILIVAGTLSLLI